ncbi:MAG: futalosine hydrolase [Saprospiraceae bacterium]
MKILITAATPFEITPLETLLARDFQSLQSGVFIKNELEVHLKITGVGITPTAFHLGALFARRTFGLAINAGIAGAFEKNLVIGTVVHVVSERFGDLGVEESDGSLTDVHELELTGPDESPFEKGELRNPAAETFDFLPKCKGLTVNKVHGSEASITAIRKKYTVDVESMEGAAFFYACLMAKQPFLEIRAISNYVEPRNREAWNLPLAIDNLNEVLFEILQTLA